MALINIEKLFQTADTKNLERRIEKLMNEQEERLGKTLSEIQAEQAKSEERAEARHATSQQQIADLEELVKSLKENAPDLTDEIASAEAILQREKDYLAEKEEPGGGEDTGGGETGGGDTGTEGGNSPQP